MKVTTNIKKLDLIHCNLMLLPRSRHTYVMIFVIAIAIFVFISWKHGIPQSTKDWVGILIASVAGGLLGVLFSFIFSMISILLRSSKITGVMGEHEYTLSPEGLHEKTEANEGLSKWRGITEVKVVGPYILYQITGYLFHIVPRRSFESDEEFRRYVSSSIEYWENAHNSRLQIDAAKPRD